MTDRRRDSDHRGVLGRALELVRLVQPLMLFVLLVFAVLGFTLVSPSRRFAEHEAHLATLDTTVQAQAVLLDGLARFACLYTQPTERELLGLGCTTLLSSRRR